MKTNHDLTEIECKKAVATGKVIWVQRNPNDMGIFFFTSTSDKGFIVNKNGGMKRYKNNFDRDLVITIIKGL